eukprot:CAMPEP_0172594528 /NCGR_PEP_ID=MMETSP1068-20121228/13950_1 /TAXON_ID=35684 /ORGANISM="Pseudopedinella elastica, Strain CCMP716" /LENGTH=87 /DNA_ID=CAMNT_0013392617 /DNA_START=45 /DNA_END=305 /DNA_ORIENTATION=+
MRTATGAARGAGALQLRDSAGNAPFPRPAEKARLTGIKSAAQLVRVSREGTRGSGDKLLISPQRKPGITTETNIAHLDLNRRSIFGR